MRKLLFGASLLVGMNASAQTLFTYGRDSVSVKEFLQAFKKNNPQGGDAQAKQEYLDLYIASRLKIKEALARGYDTLPQVRSDVQNLREQLLPAYQADAATLNRLIDEAFTRSQKDIHLAHIFIGFANAGGKTDSAGAKKKAAEAFAQLQRHADFAQVAARYSDDSSARENGGDLGFITVFSLPYELENLAYATPPGKVSTLHVSKGGYHIFKNIEERPAAGRMKALQILVLVPPGAQAAQERQAKALADSLYGALQQGADFGALATQFSADNISAATRGTIPEFGVGQFDALFEKTVYGLKDGETSPPFKTTHGYHIVRRVGLTPVTADRNDEAARQVLKIRVENSDRMNVTREVLAKRVMKEVKFQQYPVPQAQLWAYTNKVVSQQPVPAAGPIKPSTPLLAIGKKQVTAADWTAYATSFRYKPEGKGVKPYPQVWNEFLQAKALEYYKENLEVFNDEFRNQMKEFREGNLFFEIMQRQVWTPAQTDTAGLLKFYEQHKQDYQWDKSAQAVIFFAGDTVVARRLAAQVKKEPARWKLLVAEMQNQVTADSGRFELAQIPRPKGMTLKEGLITEPQVNEADNTASFAYVLHLYDQPAQRSFAEAKTLLVNNYQAELEKKWIAELKARYPVTINRAALKNLMSN
ncbi:peptidylprolyl isomerase [Paraflavisolibacter sp. H34]|uniref:peptidylprolyl isomerase n=1 Tax=Huijunlia imazamoxiresistens TaxID=3127457 RepID=UPI003019E9B4